MKKVKTALAPLKGGVRVVFLNKENDLNKVLKNQKKSRDTINVLFVSLWDDWCSDLVDKINAECANDEAKEVVYVVNSYSMPHSFVIFNSTKLPHLVRIVDEKVHSEDYLPIINQFFGLN